MPELVQFVSVTDEAVSDQNIDQYGQAEKDPEGKFPCFMSENMPGAEAAGPPPEKIPQQQI